MRMITWNRRSIRPALSGAFGQINRQTSMRLNGGLATRVAVIEGAAGFRDAFSSKPVSRSLVFAIFDAYNEESNRRENLQWVHLVSCAGQMWTARKILTLGQCCCTSTSGDL